MDIRDILMIVMAVALLVALTTIGVLWKRLQTSDTSRRRRRRRSRIRKPAAAAGQAVRYTYSAWARVATAKVTLLLIVLLAAGNILQLSMPAARSEVSSDISDSGASRAQEFEHEFLMAKPEEDVRARAAQAVNGQTEQLAMELVELRAQLATFRRDNNALEATLAKFRSDPDPSDPGPPTPAEAIDAYMASMGWTPGSYRLGGDGNTFCDTTGIVWKKPDAGQYSFTAGQIRSCESLAGAFATVPGMREAVLAADSNVPAVELERIYSARHHIPVQILEDGIVQGNTYLVNGRPVFTDTDRPVRAGDVIWIYVGEDGNVLSAGNVRADCGNPGVTRIVPRQPGRDRPDRDRPDRDRPDRRPPDDEVPPPDEEVPPDDDEKPKCFDEAGNPIFDGELCGRDDGASEQEPRDDEVEDIPGYEEDRAEDHIGEQDDAVGCIERGDCDPLDPTGPGIPGDPPGESVPADPGASPNPDYDPEDESPGTGEGVDNDPGSPEADTGEDAHDPNPPGDPLGDLDLPNVP